MQFNSIFFIFFFLPIVLAGYYLVPGKIKNLFLLLLSLFLYTWGDKIFVLVLIYSTVANYNCALLIEDGNKKLGLTLAFLVNLLLLGFFKYYNFSAILFHDLLSVLHLKFPYFESIPGLAAPIGISFYTFKTLSYAIDVSRLKVKASRNFIDFATYVTMFPPIVAGPIIRYTEVKDQLTERRLNLTNIAEGVERFIIGLAKKMLIANTFASVADNVFSSPLTDLSTSMAWIGIIAYSFQIYFDFSGYSDMAIGLGKMLGFNFLENFNYPYISRNIREFWKRWHISLSTWLRDYLFLPLAFSLSRRLKKESYFSVRTDHILYLISILVTFLVCGFWHGASLNFIAWGLWFGLFIAIEHIGFGRILKRAWIPLQHIYTLMVIVLGWVIFRSESLPQALGFIVKLFSFSKGSVSLSSYLYFFNVNRELFFVTFLAVLFSTPFYLVIKEKATVLFNRNYFYRISLAHAGIIILLSLFIVSMSYITSGTINAFIYARF